MSPELILQNYNNLRDLLQNEGFPEDQIDQKIDQIFQTKIGKSLAQIRQELDPKVVAPQLQDTQELVQDLESDEKTEKVINMLRSAGQGALMGGYDEIEGMARSIYFDRPYEETVAEVRQEMNDFREQNPKLAQGYEVGGSFLLPSFLIGKLANSPSLALKLGEPIRNLLKRSTIGGVAGGATGFTYGALSADPDPTDSTLSSVGQRIVAGAEDVPLSTVTGAVVTPATQRLTELAVEGGEKIAQKVSKAFGGSGGKGPPPTDSAGNIIGDGADPKDSRQGIRFLLRSLERDDVQIPELFKRLDEMINLGVSKGVTLAELLGQQGRNMAMVASRAPGVGPELARRSFEDIGQTTRRQGEKAVLTMDPKRPTPFAKAFKDDKDPKGFFQMLNNYAWMKSRKSYDLADPVEFGNQELADEINRAMQRDDVVGQKLKEIFNYTKGQIRFRHNEKQRSSGMKEILATLKAKNIPPTQQNIKALQTQKELVSADVWEDMVEGTKPILHWHELSKAMGETAKNLKGSEEVARGTLNRLQKQIDTKLSEANSDFAKGQAVYRTKAQMSDAFSAGRSASDPNVSSVEAKTQLRNLDSPAEKNHFRLGFALRLWKNLDKVKSKNPNLESTIDAYSLGNQEKINAILGKDNAEKFFRKFDILGDRAVLAGKLREGSPTELLKMTREDMQLDPTLMQTAKTITGKVANPGQTLSEIGSELGTKRLERVQESMSPLLFNQGPQATRKSIQALADEQRRVQNMMRNRSFFTGATPATVAPLLGDVSPLMYYGLLFGD